MQEDKNEYSNILKLVKRICSIIIDSKEILIILLFGFILHIINNNVMPRLFIDEGMYLSRAWSLITYHSIDIYPLTYDYDHPFLGWILLALFIPFTPEGMWIERARFVMGYFSLITILFVYLISLKYFNKKTAIGSAILIAFTEEFILISRLVLIDNIAICFLLASFYFFEPTSRKRCVISAILLGLAGLVKYTTLIFIPGFFILLIYKMYFEKDTNTKLQKLVIKKNLKKLFLIFLIWLVIVGLIFSIWPLYAIINQELYDTQFTNGLLPRFLSQLLRGDFIPFWSTESYFINSTAYYMQRNPLIFILPLISIITSCILYKISSKSQKKKLQFNFILLGFAFPYLIFMMRGGVSYFFYYILLFPFMVMLISSFLFQFEICIVLIRDYYLIKKRRNLNPKSKKITSRFNSSTSNFTHTSTITFFSFVIFLSLFPFQFTYLTSDQSTIFYEANDWVIANLPKDAVIVSNAIFLPDLREEGFNDVHLFWRCSQNDPWFNNTILFSNWTNIDFILMDEEMRVILDAAPAEEENYVRDAYQNSYLIKMFQGENSYLSIFKVNNGKFDNYFPPMEN